MALIRAKGNGFRFWLVKETAFKGYYVSKSGKVFSSRRGQITQISQDKDRAGYPRVEFRLPRKKGPSLRKKVYVHRLVAAAFLKKPRGKGTPYVKHRNGDRTDNRAVNLAWAYWRTA